MRRLCVCAPFALSIRDRPPQGHLLRKRRGRRLLRLSTRPFAVLVFVVCRFDAAFCGRVCALLPCSGTVRRAADPLKRRSIDVQCRFQWANKACAYVRTHTHTITTLSAFVFCSVFGLRCPHILSPQLPPSCPPTDPYLSPNCFHPVPKLIDPSVP